MFINYNLKEYMLYHRLLPADIAKIFGCTLQGVYKMMKRSKINAKFIYLLQQHFGDAYLFLNNNNIGVVNAANVLDEQTRKRKQGTSKDDQKSNRKRLYA